MAQVIGGGLIDSVRIANCCAYVRIPLLLEDPDAICQSQVNDAEEITRQARSNLAFALHILPKDRRDDAVIFYAFCRVIDDLADDLEVPLAEREAGLKAWNDGLERGFPDPDPLQKDLIAMQARREIPTELLVAIIDGCRMDLQPQRFETWDDLSEYCLLYTSPSPRDS